jgi:hypothetical protein
VLRCHEQCEAKNGEACAELARFDADTLRVLWSKRACDLGPGSGCFDVANYLFESNDVTGAVAIVEPLCARGSMVACDALLEHVLPSPYEDAQAPAEKLKRAVWARVQPHVAKSCGRQCIEAAVSTLSEGAMRERSALIDAAITRCGAPEDWQLCGKLLDKLNPRKEGRALYERMAPLAEKACAESNVDACQVRYLTPDEARAMAMNDVAREAARKAILAATTAACAQHAPSHACNELENVATPDELAAAARRLCKGIAKINLCRDFDQARCGKGDVEGCLRVRDHRAACSLGSAQGASKSRSRETRCSEIGRSRVALGPRWRAPSREHPHQPSSSRRLSSIRLRTRRSSRVRSTWTRRWAMSGGRPAS